MFVYGVTPLWSSLRDDHKRSKETRIARMQRICSFTDVLFDALGLCAPDGRKDFDGFSSTGGIPRR